MIYVVIVALALGALCLAAGIYVAIIESDHGTRGKHQR